MAKAFIDEKIVDQYNAEAAFRAEAYWDTVQESNHIVQGFRYIMKNYDISIEKQDKMGKQGEGYHLCIRKKKLPRNDL